VSRAVRAAVALALALAVMAPLPAAGHQEPAARAPGIPPAVVPNPDLHLRLAAQFVATAEDGEVRGKHFRGHGLVRGSDLPHVRFVSWYGVPRKFLPQFVRLFGVYVNQLSFNPNVEVPREVPGSGGSLHYLDARDYNWNAGSLQRVGERDLYVAEPWVDHEQAEYLRRKLLAPLSERALDGRVMAVPGGRVERQKVVAAGTVLWGPQLLRDALESDRSPTYYDLLFAEQRFLDLEVQGGGEEEPSRPIVRRTRRVRRVRVPARVPDSGRYFWQGPRGPEPLEPGERWPEGAVLRDAGGRLEPYEPPPDRWKETEKIEDEPDRVPGRRSLPRACITYRFVDFPRDEDDWDHAFGVDKVRALMRERRMDLDFGAVVEGGRDKAGAGSIVALQNRLLVTLQGPFGAAMETYDVKETTGLRDYSESLMFKGLPYRPGLGARAVRDAGELLAYLPNGGQAGLLVNGEGKRIEVADGHFANDTDDKQMNPGVRTYQACARCHAPSGGYIIPRNVASERNKAGVAAKFKTREQRNRYLAFFKDQKARIEGFQKPYLEHVADLSVRAGQPGAKPWTGRDYADAIREFIAWYDAPLDAVQGAAEVGVSLEAFKLLAAKSPFARPGDMLQGESVPRKTWEVDVMPNLQILREYLRNVAGAEERREKPPSYPWSRPEN
jgi:hypothetical protein